jgi:hypothetical protein
MVSRLSYFGGAIMAETRDAALNSRINELARNLAQRRGQQEGYTQQDWQAAENQVMEEMSLSQGTAWKAEYLCDQPTGEKMGEQGAMATGATRDETESGAFKNEYLGQ